MLKTFVSALVALLMAAGLSSGFKKGDPLSGKEIFEQCAVCHIPQTPEAKAVEAPSLTGLFRRERLRNGKKVTDESVLDLINNGAPGMPYYKSLLDEDEKSDLIAFLKTI